MKRKRINASLAKVARTVHDSDEFIDHIGNIAERYKRARALESGPRGREVRQTLKGFRKHAGALCEWFANAQTKPRSLEYEALAQLGAAMRSAPNQTLASSAQISAWLQQALTAAQAAEAQLADRKNTRSASLAAEALRATFEHHGIKWSTQVNKQGASAAVRLLCAITKLAGEALTPEQARAVLIAATQPAKR